MRQERCIFRCVSCDSVICEVSSFEIKKKGIIILPGIVKTILIEKTDNKDSKNLLCLCGETVGKAVHVKKGWKYSLDSKKIRSVVHNSDKEDNRQSQMQSSSSDKQISSRKTCKEPSSCSCEKSVEFLEMKNRLQKLEVQMNSMKTENMNMFKDISKMLVKYKLEILRPQEIIWSLHPDYELNSAFVVDNINISMALNGGDSISGDSSTGRETSGH